MKSINKDINKANTLPGVFYQNKETFNSCKELIFSKTWQLIGEDSNVPLSNNAWPFLFMDGFIDEPLVLVRNKENEISGIIETKNKLKKSIPSYGERDLGLFLFKKDEFFDFTIFFQKNMIKKKKCCQGKRIPIMLRSS